MKPIVTVPNKVLSGMATEVKVFDKKLQIIIADMKKALVGTTNPKGVGLAAVQIGLPLRIFITRPTEKAGIRVFINPMIVKPSDISTDGPAEQDLASRDSKMEGCLSVPNLWGKVHRKSTVAITYQDQQGIKHAETLTGFMAIIAQHETDHINGILFVQRILEQKGKLYEVVTDENGKEVFEEVTLK